MQFIDEFIMKVDSDPKENKMNGRQYSLATDKPACTLKKTGEEAEFYDLPLFTEDLNESDFFESSSKISNTKVVSNLKNEKKNSVLRNCFMNCLSPIQGPKSSEKMELSSSTPLKTHDVNSNCNEKSENLKEMEKKSSNPSDFDFLEDDLFDDWSVNELNKEWKTKGSRDTVTFSQALKLIEEAELAINNERYSPNESVDLLTGELVGEDIEKMFEESFDLPKSNESNSDKESSNDSVVVIENVKPGRKPTAAQKLNFESEKKDDSLDIFRERIFFNSDDDFDFVTQDLLKKPKKGFKSSNIDRSMLNIDKTENSRPLRDCDMNESTDSVIKLKKKKQKTLIIESDVSEDSPKPKFRRQNITDTTKRHFREKIKREFIDLEAEVTDEVENSSDETEEEGEYDESFLDEESYLTQNCLADMTTKYLESVKDVKRFVGFKIPPARAYDPSKIFSQIPENNTDYEADSFCVNEVEEETETDLSDLEVAEKILEMSRKEKKKRRNQKFKKIK